MAEEKKNIIENVRDIMNPKITTVIEFDRPTTAYLAGGLAVAGVIIVLVWAIMRKMSNNAT